MSADTPAPTNGARFPHPPEAVLSSGESVVFAAPEVGAWVREHLLTPDQPLSNYDHAHLHDHGARVAFAWASVVLTKSGRRVLGQCSRGAPAGDQWKQAWKREQLLRLIGDEPTFVVTLDARFVAHALRTGRVADVLALIEHELYHCGIEHDSYGVEKYQRDGTPMWAVRPHEVEEFSGVVRRYGVAASAAGPLVEAAAYVRENGPDIAQATLDGLCGTRGCSSPLAVAVGARG